MILQCIQKSHVRPPAPRRHAVWQLTWPRRPGVRVRALLGSGGYEARPWGTFQITPGQCASRRRNMLRPFCFQSQLVPMWPHAGTHTRGYLFWVHGRCQAANDGHLELAVLVANYHLGCPTCMIKQLTKSYHGGGGDSILMFADSKLEVDLSQIPAGSRVEFFCSALPERRAAGPSNHPAWPMCFATAEGSVCEHG